jgi:hypothetical protein
MTIEINLVDENTLEVNDALRIVDSADGLKVTLLKTPTQAWASNRGGVLNGPAGLTVPTESRKFTLTAPRKSGYRSMGLPSTRDDIDLDPHYYANGNNGLSVAESTSRAVNRLFYTTWSDYTAEECGDPDDIGKVVRLLIKGNKGRDYVYALGGRVKNLKDSGSFTRYTLAELLQWSAIMDKAIDAPVL